MKSLLSLALTLFVVSAHAQWTTSGTNIYNSNTGNAGVGTSSPGAKLDVQVASSAVGTFNSLLWSTSNANYFLRLQTVRSDNGINQRRSTLDLFKKRQQHINSLTICNRRYRQDMGMEQFCGNEKCISFWQKNQRTGTSALQYV